jgi:translation initiation factor IF-1
MKVTLKRPKSKYYDESKFKIYVNGQQVATLQENQSQEIEVNSQSVSIKAKINWASSKKTDIKVSEGDVIEFRPNPLFSKMAIILPSFIVILFILAKNLEQPMLKWLFGVLLAIDILLIIYLLISSKWIYIDHTKHYV